MARKPGRPWKADAIRRSSAVINVRVEADLKALIDSLAELEGVSRRVLLRRLAEAYVDGVDEKTRRQLRRMVRERLKDG